MQTKVSFSCLTVHLNKVWLWLCVGVDGQPPFEPPSNFSLCPNKKHIYKYSFALPGMYDNPIHFGQSICSVYTHRVGGELKGLYDHWPGKTTGRRVALYTAFFKRPSLSHRAPLLGSACLGKSEKYIDLMPWACPTCCSLPKRLPLFTFRSIRAVNFSENTVIVAVVKRYEQLCSLFISVLFSSFFFFLSS